MFNFKNKNENVEKKEEVVIDDGFKRVYNIQLFYKEEPIINTDNILNRLKKSCGDVDVLYKSDKEEMVSFIFKDHTVEYKDAQRVPSQCIIAKFKKDIDLDDLKTTLQQSWSLKSGEDVLREVKHSIIINDMMAGGLEYKERLELFQNVVLAVLAESNCVAINWEMSGQIIDSKEYMEYVERDYLYGALNVRFYNISNGEDDEMLMDTLGLAALGLPDLQCHFKNIDPNKVSQMIYNTAYYIFEKGDIIEDGNTVQGIKPEDKWVCQHEVALVAPERIVLDINPGKGFAAGGRE
ncbi:protein of unknown function [Clostridium cavendishii DSM 21758]|uniref:DUF4261 domain-containing protein n=1 Tax=Clostridium cavendishii DSM 21758 TaxID=1121302 RepID=A0A1M6GCW1_9CLOT|nr:DUF4261 domain-containing protein [Clostridium cavendishii]SHJ07782.1 protein of unknown function [Clostridium cavendishii DSM 21758]